MLGCRFGRSYSPLNRLSERWHCFHTASSDRFKILFLGRDIFSVLVFKELHAASDVWESIVISTYPDERVGRRGSDLSFVPFDAPLFFPAPLKLFARSVDPHIHIDTIPRGKENIRNWKPPPPFSPEGSPSLHLSSISPPSCHLLVSASFGRIVPDSVLSLFSPSRRLNLHPSLLPSYRGPAPIQHALLNGESETGVAVIEMLEKKRGVDAGELWGMIRMAIPANETFIHLRDKLGTLGGKLLVSVLRDMLAEKARSTPQRAFTSSHPRASMIRRTDAMVDFNTMSAEDIIRRYRAIGHQRPLTTKLPNGLELQLHSPSVLSCPPHLYLHFPTSAITYDARTECLLVRCVNGTLLTVPLVKQEGRALLTAKDWWNGVRGSAWWDGGNFVRLERVTDIKK